MKGNKINILNGFPIKFKDTPQSLDFCYFWANKKLKKWEQEYFIRI
jgi:hypothetical protein